MIKKKFPLSCIMNGDHIIEGYEFKYFKTVSKSSNKYKSAHKAENGRVFIKRFDKAIRATFRSPYEIVVCFYEPLYLEKWWAKEIPIKERTYYEKIVFLESLSPQRNYGLAYTMGGKLP